MRFPVSPQLHNRVRDKLLDIRIEHCFYDMLVDTLDTVEKKRKRARTISINLSYAIYPVAMLSMLISKSSFWTLVIGELAAIWGIGVSVISQNWAARSENLRSIRDTYMELSRLLDEVEDLWFYVDGEVSDNVDQEVAIELRVQTQLSHHTGRFTELKNRFPGMHSKYASLHAQASSLVSSAVQTD